MSVEESNAEKIDSNNFERPELHLASEHLLGLPEELQDFFRSKEMRAGLDGEHHAGDGREAFELVCEIHAHDALTRDCYLQPLPDPLAQQQRIDALAAGRAALVARLDAVCNGVALPAPVLADSASNDATPDPERRLALLRALGGSATYRRNEWKFTGIAAMVASEKSEGRKRSDEKTIRADLKEAAQNELEARRAGFGSGLGQR